MTAVKKKDRINFFVDVKGLSPMNESRALFGWVVGYLALS